MQPLKTMKINHVKCLTHLSLKHKHDIKQPLCHLPYDAKEKSQ